jgi:hypothetical protein
LAADFTKGLTLNIFKLFIFLFPFSTLANISASDVYNKTKGSIVVVHSYDESGEVNSQGSGVVYTNALIITNKHVVENSNKLKISHSSSNYDVELVGYINNLDIAILKVLNAEMQPINVAKNSPNIGDVVYTLGAPKGLDLTLANGIVSSFRDSNIQTTAPISPGSSGGALLDKNGELLGITTFKIQGGENLNFAISMNSILAGKIIEEKQGKSSSPLIKENHIVYTSNHQTLLINVGTISVDSGLVYFDFVSRSLVQDSPIILETTYRKALNCSANIYADVTASIEYINGSKEVDQHIVFDKLEWKSIKDGHDGYLNTYKLACKYKQSSRSFLNKINSLHNTLAVSLPYGLVGLKELLINKNYPIKSMDDMSLTELGFFLAANNPNYIKFKSFL